MARFVRVSASSCDTPSCQPGVLRPGVAHVSSHALREARAAIAERAGTVPAYLQQDFEELLQLLDDALDDRHQRAIDLRVAEAAR